MVEYEASVLYGWLLMLYGIQNDYGQLLHLN